MPDEIKLVLFDMDNVLCEYDRGRRVAFLAELAGTTSEFVYKAIWESGFELLGDSGTLDAADYLRGFGERIGYPLSLDEWVEARRRSMKADRAVLEIARRLHETVDVAVLTNNTTLVSGSIDRSVCLWDVSAKPREKHTYSILTVNSAGVPSEPSAGVSVLSPESGTE